VSFIRRDDDDERIAAAAAAGGGGGGEAEAVQFIRVYGVTCRRRQLTDIVGAV